MDKKKFMEYLRRYIVERKSNIELQIIKKRISGDAGFAKIYELEKISDIIEEIINNGEK